MIGNRFRKNNRMCVVTMVTVGFVLALAVSGALVVGLNTGDGANAASSRAFTIDNQANTFLMDGKPFRYVSGSFHYFRALPQTWRTKLRTMRSAGVNAVSTYVEWSLHNPKDGEYNFDGIANVEEFIKIAQEEDLYVLLRPGPYICAERDNGGIPYWLFKKYPNIKLRTSDPDYKKEVALWYEKLLPRLQKYLYGNGGPIIMVQVENEYGSFYTCDKNYQEWLRDETEKYVQQKALLYTTDPPNALTCGKIEGVFATVDFGIERAQDVDEIFEKNLRSVQPSGPLVNSEFYPGWLTHWQEDNQRRDADKIAETLKKMLNAGANVNFYMFFGGTNFGFTAGANYFDRVYSSDLTSYDYDAVMDEAGDPTPKFLKVRNIIREFLPLPSVPVPDKAPKMALNPIKVDPIMFLLSPNGLKYLSVAKFNTPKPLSFEALDQFSGLVLYETTLPKILVDPSLLTVNDLRDRAFVFIDSNLIGILSRENSIYSLPVTAGIGTKLQILVENQGRINFDVANDTKGILGKVTLQQRTGMEALEILDWTSYSIPLEFAQVGRLVDAHKSTVLNLEPTASGQLLNGPIVYYGELIISSDEIHDTYIDPSGWGKGVIYVNGFNLGRYWPLVGPQITLYLPKDILKKGQNEIVVIEYQKYPRDLKLGFTITPRLDGV